MEDRLKRGELRAVVCSTSLELGIDIGSVDLVVMLSTPRCEQSTSTGRTRGTIHVTSRGVLMATNVSDLVRPAPVLLARKRHLDEVQYRAPLTCSHNISSAWGAPPIGRGQRRSP